MEKRLDIEAKLDNLDEVNAFVESELEALGCSIRLIMKLNVAVEEVFVNIAHYAYAQLDPEGNIIPDTGTGPMTLVFDADDSNIKLTFIDQGHEFNPLAREDPDTTLSAEERQIGGLGIYMVKQSMDEVHYKYEDGKNMFTLIHSLQE